MIDYLECVDLAFLWLTPCPSTQIVNAYFDLIWLHEIGIRP